MNKITIKTALQSDNVSYRDLYNALQDANIGFWDGINSTDIIEMYLKDMIEQGTSVSHILKAIEKNHSKYDDWKIWLGNSMETPEPINSKEDLIDALGLEESELDQIIEVELLEDDDED